MATSGEFVIASLRKVAGGRNLNRGLTNGKDVEPVSQRVRSEFPDLHESVLREAIESGHG